MIPGGDLHDDRGEGGGHDRQGARSQTRLELFLILGLITHMYMYVLLPHFRCFHRFFEGPIMDPIYISHAAAHHRA
jgi:hypothetical protein